MLNFAEQLEAVKHEPQWLKEQRSSAWQKFSQLPMPNNAEESWRLLDLSTIDLNKLTAFAVAPHQESSNKDIDLILELSQKSFQAHNQIRNHIDKPAALIVDSIQGVGIQLDEEIAKQGVLCTTLAGAITKHSNLIQSVLSDTAKTYDKEKFALLNQAFGQAGIFIYVPDNVELKKPFICLNLFETDSMSKMVVIGGKNSQFSLINVLAGTVSKDSEPLDSNKQVLVNYGLQIHLQAGSKLDYAELQDFDDDIFAVKYSNYSLDRDSNMSALIAVFGAGQLKEEVNTVLKERGAECTVNGMILGNRKESFNFNTIDDHSAPDTKSSIDVRVVLKDEAKSIYHGNIEVAKEAQKTNAFQSNKNLLLGEKAHADSIPKLEILADDVKCSHGATVGPVDRNQLFYLMSRGLSAAEAEQLVVIGFFHQLIADCKIEGVEEWLDSMVDIKILDSPANVAKVSAPKKSKDSSTNKKEQPALVK